ncbi:glyoxalase domain-containing protein 4 [Onthophagus taurus]|uniref:glyoxalase domain-containing protein 4 n=1 Tax=Onthophagus taurus TaxID=166361 RepID=UPI0039BE4F3F
MGVLCKTSSFIKTVIKNRFFSLKSLKMCSCDNKIAKPEIRTLHYVFKIADRRKTMEFYKNILGMKVLRHEEFADGCEASCNGPYANRWSKTMVGYGPEDDHFVFELTYNYPIHHYDKGNDFIGVTIKSQDILKRAAENSWPIIKGNVLEAPGGYKFFIDDEPQSDNPIDKVTFSCSNLEETINYWNCILGMKVYSRDDEIKTAILGYSFKQTKLEFIQISEKINRAEAFGRIAFSCPDEQQLVIEAKVKQIEGKILVPLTSLDTPGKATVRVIILADPDGLEICFVNDAPFRKLSQYTPDDEKILIVQMQKDDERMLEEKKI